VFSALFLPAGKEVIFLAHIIVDENEILEKAIKRFKRMVEKEGIIREYKKREYFEKPSTILNRKKKAMRRKLLKKSRKGRSDY
jgi:small subunit ribosomal protein S21